MTVRIFPIVVDTREQKPFPFPEFLTIGLPGSGYQRPKVETVQLRVVRQELPAGDYLLGTHPCRTIIERKGSLFEVATNCLSGDRKRFLKALDKLREAAENPVLILEGAPTQVRKVSEENPECLAGLSQLVRDVSERGIALEILDARTARQRRDAGYWIALRLVSDGLRSTQCLTKQPHSEPTAPAA